MFKVLLFQIQFGYAYVLILLITILFPRAQDWITLKALTQNKDA